MMFELELNEKPKEKPKVIRPKPLKKGKGKKLKFREIEKPTFESTKFERVYEIDTKKLLEDELKNQRLEKQYNETIKKWKNTPFYKPKKKNELAELANQLEFQLRNRQAREMDDSLIQTKNPSQQHYAKIGKDKDGNIIIPKGFIVSSNTKPESKTRKKGMQVLRKRAAAEAQRKIGGRRSRKKRKKLMCPKNCCGVPVDKCGCPVSCPHCNCPEIKRLRKLLKKTRKKCNKKRKKTRRKKGGRKDLRLNYEEERRRRRRRDRGRRTLRTLRPRPRAGPDPLRLAQERAIQRFRIQVINRGQLTETLTSFIRHIRRVLSEPTLQTREKYEHLNAMYGVLNRTIGGEVGEITVEISPQDRSRIDLIGNLLRQFRTQIEEN